MELIEGKSEIGKVVAGSQEGVGLGVGAVKEAGVLEVEGDGLQAGAAVGDVADDVDAVGGVVRAAEVEDVGSGGGGGPGEIAVDGEGVEVGGGAVGIVADVGVGHGLREAWGEDAAANGDVGVDGAAAAEVGAGADVNGSLDLAADHHPTRRHAHGAAGVGVDAGQDEDIAAGGGAGDIAGAAGGSLGEGDTGGSKIIRRAGAADVAGVGGGGIKPVIIEGSAVGHVAGNIRRGAEGGQIEGAGRTDGHAAREGVRGTRRSQSAGVDGGASGIGEIAAAQGQGAGAQFDQGAEAGQITREDAVAVATTFGDRHGLRGAIGVGEDDVLTAGKFGEGRGGYIRAKDEITRAQIHIAELEREAAVDDHGATSDVSRAGESVVLI